MAARTGAGDIDATPPQGALQLGTEQISQAGRTHRPRAQGAETIEPRDMREPRTSSDLKSQSKPPLMREPNTSSKRRPINIPHDPTEQQLHQSVAELLDWILKEPAFYTTFPAGWGKLTKGTAGRLFASGLKKGMPDILVFGEASKVVGIELKTGKNSVTSAQRTMHARLQAVGITVYVCRSQEDVLASLHRESISCHSFTMMGRGGDAGAHKQEPI